MPARDQDRGLQRLDYDSAVAEVFDDDEIEGAAEVGLFDAQLYRDPFFLLGAGMCFLGGLSAGRSYASDGIDLLDDVPAVLIDTVVQTAISLLLFAYLPASLRRRLRRRRQDAELSQREFTSDVWVILLAFMFSLTGFLFGQSATNSQVPPATSSPTQPSLWSASGSPSDPPWRAPAVADKQVPTQDVIDQFGDLEMFRAWLSVNYGREISEVELLEAIAMARVVLAHEDSICRDIEQRSLAVDTSDPEFDWAEDDPERLAALTISIAVGELLEEMEIAGEADGGGPLSGLSKFVFTNLVELNCMMNS